MKKKLKGFTLVELIVVCALFSLIMAAVLSVLNPIASVYQSTATNEHMRASCDNVRLYVEENLRYADRLKICYKSSASDARTAGDKMINGFKSGAEKTVGTDKIPLYIMEINNDNEGKINVFRFTGGSVPLNFEAGTPYKQINENLYGTYAYTFNIPADFGLGNAVLDIDIVKKVPASGGGSWVIPDETDDRYMKLSTASTFSFINLKNFLNVDPSDTEVKYLTADGEDLTDPSGKYRLSKADAEKFPGAIKVDVKNPESSPFQGCDAGSGNNVYFVYTLPKFINEYGS